MKLRKISLTNFRCYKNQVSVDIGAITALIGKNDSGKSTLMDALDIFFGNSKMDVDDRNRGVDENSSVVIICEFSDFPDEITLDATAKTSLKEEFLLNENGRLAIKKVFSGKGLGTVKVSANAFHPVHPKVEELVGLKITELKTLAKDLEVDTTKVKLTTKCEIRCAIWKHLNPTEFKLIDVPLDKEDGKAAWEQIEKHLPVFALFRSDRASKDQDEEAQDPLKTAVREALKAKEEELKSVIQHVETQVKEIADATLRKLREMDPTLASQLHPKFEIKPWDSLFKVSISGDEGIPINKRGSGVRRLILINFFRAKAERMMRDKQAPSVIYAVEEPETSQHPDNQRILFRALCDLLQTDSCQVLLTTHTPTLAKTLDFTQLRYIKGQHLAARSVHAVDASNWQEVSKTLGVLPDHDVHLFIGVEGPHDVSFLCNLADALIADGHSVPDLRKLEIDGRIIFFPQGGSTLTTWKNRLHRLARPEFRLYDRDTLPPHPGKYEQAITDFLADPLNTHPKTALQTKKRELENYIHLDAITAALMSDHGHAYGRVMAFTDFEDVPKLLVSELNPHFPANSKWGEGRVKHLLNGSAVGKMTKTMLDSTDPSGEVLSWFQEMQRLMDLNQPDQTVEQAPT